MRNLYSSRAFLDVAVPKSNVSAMCSSLQRRWGSKGDLAASLRFFTMHWILKELYSFREGLVEIVEGLCKSVSAKFLGALWDARQKGSLSLFPPVSCRMCFVVVLGRGLGLSISRVVPVPKDSGFCALCRAPSPSKGQQSPGVRVCLCFLQNLLREKEWEPSHPVFCFGSPAPGTGAACPADLSWPGKGPIQAFLWALSVKPGCP